MTLQKKRRRRRNPRSGQHYIDLPFKRWTDRVLSRRCLVSAILRRCTPSDSSSKKKAKQYIESCILISRGRRFKAFASKYQKFIETTLDVDVTKELLFIVYQFERVAIYEGPVQAIKLFKKLYDLYLRLITSNDFERISFLKANRIGFPKIMGPLIRLAKGSYTERRAGLAVLGLLKVIKVHGESFSTTTIESEAPIPQMGFDNLPKEGDFFKRFVESPLNKQLKIDLNLFRTCYLEVLEMEFPKKETRRRLNDIRKFSSMYLSGRNGPNGPSLLTVCVDYAALHRDKVEGGNLLNSIQSMSLLTANSILNLTLSEFETNLLSSELANSENREPIHSKISLKKESWGKVRPFAICDYFSQSALNGFHKYLFRYLRTLEEDGTFDQDRVSRIVQKWTESEHGLHHVESADLSAATDSIPIEVQTEIICAIAGPRFAKLWRIIVSDRKFRLPDGRDVRYTCGQPMGLLSSWAMLAVWHHIMLKSVYLYVSKSFTKSYDDIKPKYLVIGDDVSMLGSYSFSIYKEVVSICQGVGISKIKGFHEETQNLSNMIPDVQCNKPHVAELAKRVFYNGREITIVPADEVKTSFESSSQFPELLNSLESRGYPELPITKIPLLANICESKYWSLLLSLSPLRKTPIKVSPELRETPPFKDLIWFKPDYDHMLFKEQITGIFIERINAADTLVLDKILKWVSIPEENVSVKKWCYTNKAQRNILKRQAIEWLDSYTPMAVLFFSEDQEFSLMEAIRNDDISGCKSIFKRLDLVYDLDYLLMSKSIRPRIPEALARSNFIAKAIKELVSNREKIKVAEGENPLATP